MSGLLSGIMLQAKQAAALLMQTNRGGSSQGSSTLTTRLYPA
jgi:hypothetical protein